MNFKRSILGIVDSILSRKRFYLMRSLVLRDKLKTLPNSLDYVRYFMLELCYEEIIANNVKGNTAELGVYKGDFSRQINYLFSDRKIYLFDTFKGFDTKDIRIDQENEFSYGNQDFSDTSVDAVMKKMPYPDNCIIKKGFFPETAFGISDSFCFVSIDADLFKPIYEGLNFFYPLLEKGGYIFVHDYNNNLYKGAKQAVLKFCKENNISFIPIPDTCGTVIILK
ncbi:MAG: macrocin O-methyltransferase [Bacteroidales bacterium]|jgi:O-methyltransferase|nr:TylF/MycF family methyltransferase [Bacteroidales bacterium]MDD4213772.1 macrocin O-methyltransferase [Bacteroidales bacterium]